MAAMPAYHHMVESVWLYHVDDKVSLVHLPEGRVHQPPRHQEAEHSVDNRSTVQFTKCQKIVLEMRKVASLCFG